MIALVCGSAPSLHDDLARLEGVRFDRIYAANFAAFLLPRVDVWVSGHPEEMPKWQPQYLEKFPALPEIVVTPGRIARVVGECQIDRIYHPRVSGPWKLSGLRFDSGFVSVQVALSDGAERVVVAGVQLDRSGNLNDWTPEGHSYTHYRRTWAIARSLEWRGRVRACSGHLAKRMGRPDPAWLGAGGA